MTAVLAATLPRWLLDILSVDTQRLQGGTEHFRFARFPEGGLGLLAVLALVAGFALIVWNYRREGQLAVWKKLLLSALRCLVLLVAALAIFYPVLEVDRKQEVRASTILLVDESLSQGIRDRYLGDAARRDAAAMALGMQPEEVAAASRAELVDRALGSRSMEVLPRLAQANRLEAYGFAGIPLHPLLLEETPPSSVSVGGGGGADPGASAPGVATPDAGPRLSAKVEPTGSVTDIAGALRAAVEEEGTGRIAGIVLITDGRITAGEDLKGVGTFLAEKGIPVHAVGVGDPTRTRNYRVGALLASEKVFVGDPVVVDVRIDQHGFDGETVAVDLLDAYEPAGEPERAPVKVETVNVSFPEGRTDAMASFRFEPDGVGRHRITARVAPHPEEAFTDDNERTASLEVLKEASKVLLLSGGPSFEYRFLKNLLRRDSRVRLAAWLMSADPDYPQEGNVSLKRIPDTAKDLFEYDVVILMDPDPRGLPAGFAPLLEQFVGKHRGGLLFVAGDKYAVPFFEDPSMGPVRDLLPVIVEPTDVKDELERGKFYEREWPLVPTPAAMDHAGTRLSSQIDRNRQRWGEIAGVYWSFPTRKAKPGATVLFVHSDPSLARDGQPRPIVATQFYEGGRVAWCGIDSTWQWRATAEEVYDRFWIQMSRFLTEGRLLGDRRRLVQTDAETYELGGTMRISALLEDENYRPVEADEAVVVVEDPRGSTTEVKLTKDSGSPGWFRGIYVPRVLGAHKLRLVPGAERIVTVEPPALEFAEPRLDEETLRELAALTGGSYAPLADIASVPDRIPDRRQTVVTTDEPIPLWDNWTTLGLIAFLLALEWIFRKVSRLL